LGQPTDGREQAPKLNHVGPIHLQEFNRHSSFRGFADDAMMPQSGIIFMELAVFASSTSPLSDEVPKLRRNPLAHRVA
jgi:hypothetical protein